jgi:hypothetical protein
MVPHAAGKEVRSVAPPSSQLVVDALREGRSEVRHSPDAPWRQRGDTQPALEQEATPVRHQRTVRATSSSPLQTGPSVAMTANGRVSQSRTSAPADEG